MTGMQPTHIKPNGLALLKIGLAVILLATFLCGCSAEMEERFLFWLVGDGRGDWTMDLINGYAIVKVNSHTIKLTNSCDDGQSTQKASIPYYFVKSYQLCDTYICLSGIPTGRSMATEQELESTDREFYIVDSISGEVYGPYKTYEDFLSRCEDLNIEPVNGWDVPARPKR